MKTRSNMPLFVVECSDVKALSNSQINQLRCGDYLVKKDASGEHAYKVTFKKEGVGMCLTYHDASVIETQSYDYIDGNWVYNSEDKTPNLLEVVTEDSVAQAISGKDISPKDVSSSGNITANSIIENMSGYSWTGRTYFEWIAKYVGAVKTGNKLTFVVFGSYTKRSGDSGNTAFGFFDIPSSIAAKLYPFTIPGGGDSVLDVKVVDFFRSTGLTSPIILRAVKSSNSVIINLGDTSSLTDDVEYIFRYEITFLLNDSLAESN